MVSTKVKLAVSFAVALAALPAQAQFMGPGWKTHVALTRADLDMIRATVTGRIHNARPGSTASWSNPASGNSGTVKLLDVFHRQGRRCERIEYHNIPANKARPTERLVMTSCRQPDGTWKLSTAGR